MTHTTIRNARPSRPTAEAASDWYPTGLRGISGEWDGTGWTGRSRPDAAGATPPEWRRRFLPFLGHLWFWMFVAGTVVVIAAGALGANGLPEAGWVVIAAIGLTIACSALIAMLWPLVRFDELRNKPLLVGVGIVGGVVASYLAWGVQHFLEPSLNMPVTLDLWLAGPVEETSKLLVPVLLLVFSRRLFGDPRAGLLMVMVSAAVFGIGEGIDYMQRATDGTQLIITAGVRGAGESVHVAWTAIAAVLIWLAAHRSGRLFTWAGLVGWLIPVVLHSVHDGIGPLDTRTHITSGMENLSNPVMVPVALVFANVATLVFVAIAVLIIRVVAREIVPPTAISHNPPRWRPRLKPWGTPRADRQEKHP